jgi:hypothetical protein
MNIVHVTDDASIEAFARRIAPANTKPKKIAAMIESIRAANPGVDPTALSPGALLFVPSSEASTGGSAAVTAGLIATLRIQLEAAATDLKMLAEQQLSLANAQEQKMTEALAGNKAQIDAARAPGIADAVTALRNNIKDQAAAAKTQSHAIDAAIAEWRGEFGRLAGDTSAAIQSENNG